MLQHKELKLVNILLFIMLAIFPLFSVNHYFNLTLAKYWFYSVVALAIFFMGVYGSICKSIDKNHKIVKPDIKLWFSKMSKLDSFVFLYVIMLLYLATALFEILFLNHYKNFSLYSHTLFFHVLHVDLVYIVHFQFQV